MQLNTDLIYIQNNKTDTISPSVAMTEITAIVCSMLEDNIIYCKKYGFTDKAQDSRKKLLKLLDITETFNSITSSNETLKIYNNQLLRENQSIRAELKEVKRQENVANSI